MDRKQQETPAPERWLTETTDRLRGNGPQTEPRDRAALKPQPCWQCSAPARIQLPIGTVHAHLCRACAEQTRQLLTVALHGSDPLFHTDEDDEDVGPSRWGNA
jgi:hypothetical protein